MTNGIERITDYRTETEKRRDAIRERVIGRYHELRAEGLTRHRSCVVAAQEAGIGVTTAHYIVSRAEAAAGTAPEN